VSLMVINDRAYLAHAPGNWPEGPHRLEAIWSMLQASGVEEALVYETPDPAGESDLELVHTPRHIERVRRLAEEGGGNLTLDTVVSPESYRTALLAAGGAMKATDLVLAGRARRAAALVRPPGHHATPDEGMGFCLFNNIAVAAAHARHRRGVKRILIVDWDLHHGNGTEAAFYGTDEVLFFSCHESPAYPGTGWVTDVGEGRGEGYTVNVPLPPGSGDAVYEEVFESVLAPIARAYGPEIILVSCGLDAHFADPLGRLRLTSAGYGRLAGIVTALADELCDGRVVFVLEGGYDPVGLGWSLASVFNVASGRGGPLTEPEDLRAGFAAVSGAPPAGTAASMAARERIAAVRSVQRTWWPV